MKTIFITAFEGVEVKNILRTDVLPTFLRDPEVSIVLFMKNEERAARYRAEFDDPRIMIEVAPRPAIHGLDAFFARLKFALLRTRSTRLRRRLAYERGGSGARYALAGITSFLFARPPIRRLVRAIDFRLVRNRTYAAHFARYRPDLVFLAHLFDEPEVHLLREATRRFVPTVGLVNSWDKVTARCMLRLLPKNMIVFNDLVKQELITHNEMRGEDIAVLGMPQYDHYLREKPISREDFFHALGLSRETRLIVYGPAGSAYSDADWHVIDMLERMNQEGQFGERVRVLVRFQPNDFIEATELAKRPRLLYDYPGIRFSTKRGVDWDMGPNDLAHLRNTLAHMALFISYGSSMTIDAALFDKPVIHLNFVPGNLAQDRSPTRFYEMDHNRNVHATAAARLVSSEAELAEWVRTYLAHPETDREERRMLVRQQCAVTDGKSGERIGAYLLRIMNRGA